MLIDLFIYCLFIYLHVFYVLIYLSLILAGSSRKKLKSLKIIIHCHTKCFVCLSSIILNWEGSQHMEYTQHQQQEEEGSQPMEYTQQQQEKETEKIEAAKEKADELLFQRMMSLFFWPTLMTMEK